MGTAVAHGPVGGGRLHSAHRAGTSHTPWSTPMSAACANWPLRRVWGDDQGRERRAGRSLGARWVGRGLSHQATADCGAREPTCAATRLGRREHVCRASVRWGCVARDVARPTCCSRTALAPTARGAGPGRRRIASEQYGRSRRRRWGHEIFAVVRHGATRAMRLLQNFAGR